MSSFLRTLRAMCGLGALWAVIWTPIGVGIVVLQWLASGYGPPPLEMLAILALGGVRNGFLAGFLFAGGLGLVYRKRAFTALRTGVVGAIGGVAGMLLPAASMIAIAVWGRFTPPPLTVAIALAFGGALGAGTAIGSLKLARAAPSELEPGPPATQEA